MGVSNSELRDFSPLTTFPVKYNMEPTLDFCYQKNILAAYEGISWLCQSENVSSKYILFSVLVDPFNSDVHNINGNHAHNICRNDTYSKGYCHFSLKTFYSLL